MNADNQKFLRHPFLSITAFSTKSIALVVIFLSHQLLVESFLLDLLLAAAAVAEGR